jgi:hypothetical protein
MVKIQLGFKEGFQVVFEGFRSFGKLSHVWLAHDGFVGLGDVVFEAD